jgi:hypothetical protein
VGFFQFLRHFHQLTAFEQAEMILYAALDPAIASRCQRRPEIPSTGLVKKGI